jgi:hypothetical protein
MLLDSGTDIQGFNIVGRSISNTNIVIDSSAVCNNIGIQKCNVSGTLDGGTRIRNCLVGDMTYVSGHIIDSFLYGTIALSGSEDAVFANCGIADPNSIPTIDMGGSGQNAVVTDYSGGIKFKNMTGDNKIAIQMDGGRVILDSTITAGFVGVNGISLFEDYSTGATVVTDGLVNKQTVTNAVWDEMASNHTTISGSTAELINQIKKLVNLIPAGL